MGHPTRSSRSRKLKRVSSWVKFWERLKKTSRSRMAHTYPFRCGHAQKERGSSGGLAEKIGTAQADSAAKARVNSRFRDFYLAAIAPTSDWNTLNPSVPPSSGSAARSGWGIIPRTLPPGLQIPAMLSSDPFGLASKEIWPSGVE